MIAPGWTSVVHEDSLADLHAVLLDALQSTGAVTDTMRHHVMSKLIPRAGMSRLFSKIAFEFMQSNAAFAREMNAIFACSLLGNYRHCDPDSRATTPLRMFVYSVIEPELCAYPGSHANVALWRMLFANPLSKLFLIAMREYMVYHVSDDPALHEYLMSQFDYESFARATVEGMASIRKCLARIFEERTTVSPDAIERMSECGERATSMSDFQSRLHAVIKAAYERAKKTGFRRRKPDPCTLLRAAKGKFPPITSWARTLGRPVYLKHPPRPDERCSATRRDSRIRKRKAAIALGDGAEVDEADDDGARVDAEAAAEEEGVAAAAATAAAHGGADNEEEEADDLRGAGSDAAAMEAKLHGDMVHRVTDAMVREQRRLERRRVLEEEDRAAEQAHAAEEKGCMPDAEHDAYGFNDAFIELLANSGDAERLEVAQKYRAARARAIASTATLPHAPPTPEYIVPRSSGECDPAAVPLTRDRVTMEHDRVLRACVSTITPTTDGMAAFEAICECVRAVGGDARGVESMRALMVNNSEGCYTDEEWKTELRQQRALYPYTYNLFHAAASVWAASPHLVVEELPASIRGAQCRAIAQRYGILPYNSPVTPAALPRRACYMHYCSVCGAIYSIVQKRVRPGKAVYTHGLRDPNVNLLTGRLYCSNPKNDGSLSCKDRELCEVPVLGRVVSLYQQTYMLCPQPGCGMLFALATYAPPSTRAGPACPVCVAKIRSRRHTIPQFIIDLTQGSIRKSGAMLDFDTRAGVLIPPPKACFVCNRAVHLNKHVRIYGTDTFVCHRHHRYMRHGMADDVAYLATQARVPAYIDPVAHPDVVVRRLLLKWISDHKAVHKESAKAHNRSVHRRHKAHAASRRAH